MNSYFLQYHKKLYFITKNLGKKPNYKDKIPRNFDGPDLPVPKGPNSLISNDKNTLFFNPSSYL